jgi:hypothetical protein
VSKSEREKGARVEREIVNAHKDMGIKAERYPLSGGSHFRGQGHDLDLYIFGDEAAPAVAEVKARADGTGFALLDRWLGDYDLLFLRRDRADPLVVLPWRTYQRLIGGSNGTQTASDGIGPREPKGGEGAQA